jgi:diacylglycerol kinase (ATP)
MAERVVIFANPIAGRGKGRLLAERLFERFEKQGWSVEVALDRPEVVSDQTLAGATAVVSIGGDGTLRSVVERVSDGGKREGPGVLVVPMGTANLMGRHLEVGLSVRGLEERAVRAISQRKVVRLDVGRLVSEHRTSDIERPTSKGPERSLQTTSRLFLLMVGVGIDGEIVHALDKVRKGPIGFASYLKPGFSTLAQYHFRPIEVEVDGKIVFGMRPGAVFVGNVKEYGTGFEILPAARSDDELLDVCVLPANSATELINHFLAAFTGEHLHGEGVVYAKGKKVRVNSNEPVAVQADGDPAGFTPVEMEILPVRVAFLKA